MTIIENTSLSDESMDQNDSKEGTHRGWGRGWGPLHGRKLWWTAMASKPVWIRRHPKIRPDNYVSRAERNVRSRYPFRASVASRGGCVENRLMGRKRFWKTKPNCPKSWIPSKQIVESNTLSVSVFLEALIPSFVFNFAIELCTVIFCVLQIYVEWVWNN